MIRFGVVGAGWFASRRHLPELVQHPEVELVALCRRSEGPLRKLAEHFGVPQTYTDLDAMLAGAQLDAVLVSSPHDLHHDQTVACLDAGCHVLLEKPMTIAAADARDLVARAEAAGRVLEVAYNPPYWTHCCWLRERIAAGELGEVETVDLRWTGNLEALFGRESLPADMPGVVPPTPFRGDAAANGGGLLIDSGSHQVCEAMWVTGRAMTSIAAVMDATPVDLRYSVSFELAGGALGTLTSIGDSAFPGRRTLGIYQGSRATATVTAAPFAVEWAPAEGEAFTITENEMPPAPQPVVSFVDAVAGRAAPRSPGADCVRYVEAIEAAYRSADSGCRESLQG